MSKKPKILYLSYDGLTDPLGQSQILAYLSRINREHNISITIISFDKPDIFEKNEKRVREILSTTTIQWHPLTYHKSPPVLSTVGDLRRGWKKIKDLYKKEHFDIVHCRGYISALLGQKAKKKFGSKFIFDMRGWWPDEKLESGLWGNPVFRPVYKYFKEKEMQFFTESDITVSLTYAGKKEITEIFRQSESKVGVIPTCVDFDVFKPFSENIRREARNKLGIPENAFVVIYSGSIGANYPPKDILKIYQSVKCNQEKHLLILSREPESLIKDAAEELGIKEKIHFASANYSDVHKFLQASDLGIILYKMAFSTIGRSPTKLGEYWACGIPAIALKDIGDLNFIHEKFNGEGLVLTDSNFKETLAPQVNKNLLRKNAQTYFDINSGVVFYKNLYLSL
ncbi:MAG: glycosyltransferase [Flavobacteriales bacterium]